MFKTGQLVRRINSSLLWIVQSRHDDGYCVIMSVSKRNWDFIEEEYLTLIGNNYQAKPKCSR